MKQKLSDWASIAEVVSGVGVIVTLTFLVLGIRENTEVTRASMYAGNLDRSIEFRQEVVNDPELSRLWMNFINGDVSELDALDALEKYRVQQLFLNIFQIYERAYVLERYGLLGAAEWGRYQVAMCAVYRRGESVGIGANALPSSVNADFMRDLFDNCELGE